MRTWVQAWRAAIDAAEPLEPVDVALWDSRGLVLASGIAADMDDPPFDRSAMDGFAVRLADAAGGSCVLPIVGELAAGASPPEAELAMGTAVRVMTGAPVPLATSGIVVVEEAVLEEGGNLVRFEYQAVKPFVRYRGEVARRGDIVVEAGRVVTPEVLGVLASVGASRVSVHRRPRVRVQATGDELVGLDAHPRPGQIRDSNRWSVAAALAETGADVELGPVIPDRLDALRAELARAAEVDVLVLTGGVSAGSYDFVMQALVDVGATVDFHKVAMKPGKPLLLARLGDALVFGLPGNPVSAVVTARLFACPAVRRKMGVPHPGPTILRVELLDELGAVGSRATFVPAWLSANGDRLQAMPIPTLGSADAVHHSQAHALIVREAHSGAASPGDSVPAIALAQSWEWR